jgi:hypothetical protein
MCDECAFRMQRILKRASERERKRIIHELDVAYKHSQLLVIPNRGQTHERITPQPGPGISQREQLVL